MASTFAWRSSCAAFRAVTGAPLGVDEATALLAFSATRAFRDGVRTWRSRRLVAEKSVYFAPATPA